jgi:hypothetical protein
MTLLAKTNINVKFKDGKIIPSKWVTKVGRIYILISDKTDFKLRFVKTEEAYSKLISNYPSRIYSNYKHICTKC